MISPPSPIVLTYFVFCPDLGAEMYLLTSFVRRSSRVSRTYLLAGGVFFAPNPRIKTDFTRIRRTWWSQSWFEANIGRQIVLYDVIVLFLVGFLGCWKFLVGFLGLGMLTLTRLGRNLPYLLTCPKMRSSKSVLRTCVLSPASANCTVWKRT